MATSRSLCHASGDPGSAPFVRTDEWAQKRQPTIGCRVFSLIFDP